MVEHISKKNWLHLGGPYALCASDIPDAYNVNCGCG